MTLLRLLLPALLCVGLLPVPPGSATIRELPVPRQTINARDIVASGDIVSRRFQTSEESVRGIALSAGDVVGLQARRRLAAGRPIPLSALRRPVVIERGQRSRAVYAGGGFTITGVLVALEEGVAGSVIAARNPDTGVIVRAMVAEDGSLRISEP